MTAEEAKNRQEELSKHYNLSFWYGTNCEKCCGVYPKLIVGGIQAMDCWYECEVCGKRTEPKPMPWLSEKDWNEGRFLDQQLSLFV